VGARVEREVTTALRAGTKNAKPRSHEDFLCFLLTCSLGLRGKGIDGVPGLRDCGRRRGQRLRGGRHAGLRRPV